MHTTEKFSIYISSEMEKVKMKMMMKIMMVVMETAVIFQV
jgi:hypothetical protein